MAKRVAISTLNASTIDILNTIRANASAEYLAQVPEVAVERDIPKVGEVLFGYPALANEFVNALVNRIAAVRIKSAVFNNAYAELKKGYLEFGETVEEVFVNIVKAREFSAEKAEARELKRYLPDVRSAFHAINWKVLYPITIENNELRQAFTSFTGVEDLIARIVNSVYTSAEYDEFLLFKYLIIKNIAHGKMYPVSVDTSDISNSAIAYRGISNMLTFLKTEYNASGVHTSTPKEDQYIFMDARYNAQFDVKVLAGAFNMDEATFMGRLTLIDDFTTFDNDRFEAIRAESDGLEEVTAAELALMQDVIGVIVDKEWFQVYDNLAQFTEKYVASGLRWNYFYHTWKTISSSPFSNAVVFVKNTATITLPSTITAEVLEKSDNENATVFTLAIDDETAALSPANYHFVQTEDATKKGIAVHKYGAYIFPPNAGGTMITVSVDGTTYTAGQDESSKDILLETTAAVGNTFTLKKVTN